MFNSVTSAHRVDGAVLPKGIANVLKFPARKLKSLPRKRRPRVLLLQGPVGPFFARLAYHLEDAGYETWRVIFNAGDRLYAGECKRIDFSGSIDEWQSWFRAFVTSADFDCVVLFGSNRPVHLIARNVARQVGIKTISLEEGYIRPGFVSVELGGNNSDSPLAGRLPPPSFVPDDEPKPSRSYNSFAAMCRAGAVYYSVRTLFSGIAVRELFHRNFNPMVEPFLWLRNAWRRFSGQARDYHVIEHLLEHYDRRYFLVPLQVASDSQMGKAARGWNSQRLIAETIASFAKDCEGSYRLVFKVHPLERGHANVRNLVEQTAAVFGVADRVDLIENGSLGLLARHAAGMVTINSTSGLSAIFHGTPLLVIGDAIYAHPQLATVARGKPDFAAFWRDRFVADADLRRRYLSWLRQNALVAGDFYAAAGIEVACKGVVQKVALATAAITEPEIESLVC